jgi:hypothetical protein
MTTLSKAVQASTTTSINLSSATSVSNITFIEQLIIEQQVWSEGAFKTSNDLLYTLLAKCYEKYEQMCADNEVGKKLRDDLNNYITLRCISVNKKSHTIIKIVKCVFGANKRRVSAYSIVLRSALAKGIKSTELVDFISTNGGVEEIRLAKNGNALTVTQKAKVAKVAVEAEVLAEFESEAIAKQLDAAKIGEQIVFVASQLANGKFVVNAVSNSATAVNAVLAAYYSANKTEISTKKTEEKIASNDEQIADLIYDNKVA